MSKVVVPLGELMQAKKRSVDPRKHPEEEFELFSIPAFDAGAPETVCGSNIGSSKQVLERHDVLLSKIVPHIRRSWVVEPSSERRMVGSSEWIIFRSGRFEPKYLRHVLISDRFHQAFMQTVAGVGGSLLRARPSYVAEIEIPLPPLEEQRRIAAVLDAAEALRAKRRQALAKIDELTQAVFYDVFGDLSNNVRDWSIRRIGDFVDSFQTGKSIALGPSDVPGDFRVLKVSAVTSRRYKPWESKPVPSLYAVPETHLVRAGDLLISRANTTELVGACAYIETTPENHLLPDKLWRFVWSEPRQVEPLFVWRLLQGQRARKEIGDLATGSSGSMKNISQQKFMQLEVPIPPLSVQEEFVRRHREILDFASSLDTGLAGLDTLFASLQQRAFRGEL